MLPEATAVDGSKSVEVCTDTPTSPPVKPPMVKPVMVITTADGGMIAPAVVMTTDVALVALHVPVSPATLLLPAATLGVTDAAKKPEGYVSVIVAPGGTAFNGVNPSVTGTPAFPAFLSDEAMENTTFMS